MSLRTTLEFLAAAFWAHLKDYPLPEPCTVTLNPRTPEIEIQVPPTEPVRHLAELLLWAYTLDQVTATWWHTESENLHVTFYGRSSGGARFRVYGGLDYARCAGLVPLAVGESEGVSVDELYTLRDLLAEEVAA
jgi:hypothetical protein